MIKLIACIDKNNGIGKDNKLLAYLPKDLQHFKYETIREHCVFGRKTFNSLPVKPLPNRETIILTKDEYFSYQGCHIVHSISDILDMSMLEDIYVCGGAEIYSQMMPYADELIITHLKDAFESDAFFPKIDSSIWTPYYRENVKDKLDFEIIKYRRGDNYGI